MTSAAEAFVAACVDGGIETAFTVPGESFLDVLDALYEHPSIRAVATRHEGGAGFMAEAWGRLGRTPALAMATRGPGAANLAIGVHTARQDSAPLVVLLGQVATRHRHRESFQEVDLAEMYRPLVKHAIEVTDPRRLGDLTRIAIDIAVSGRPGPVVLSVPEDVLEQDAGEAPTPIARPRSLLGPATEALDSVLAQLRSARRPAMLLGGGVLAANATEDAVALAEHEDLPVFAGWRRPDVFPNDHELYLGQTGYAAPAGVRERLVSADFLLVVGCRLAEVASFGYQVPAAGTQVAHVDVGPEILARSQAQVVIQADAGVFFRELLARARTLGTASRRAANQADRARWVAETTPAVSRDGALRGTDVMARLRTLMPDDAIITVDAGNFSGWIARYLRCNRPFSFLGPTSGAMGYSVPAAIGARLRSPHRPVVAFAGDGGFAMTGIELATAVAEDAPITTIVFDNGEYGTIRMHQEARHPGRQVATRLGHIDFAQFTRSLGGEGAEVDSADEFEDAFKTALASPTPFTIVVRTGTGGRSVDNDR